MPNIKQTQYKSYQGPPLGIQPGPTYESPWHQPWSEPMRRRGIAVALIAASGVTSFVDVPFQKQEQFPSGWSQPPAQLRQVQYQSQAFVALTTTEIVTEDKWHFPWSEPVRIKPGLLAALQSPFTIDPYALTQPETINESFWHQGWSIPVRYKTGLSPYLQQTLALVKAAPFGETIFEDKWHQAWSEPSVKTKKGLGAPYQQALMLVEFTFAEVVYPDKYFAQFSLPVRFKPALRPGLQQYVQHVISPITLYLQATESPDSMAFLLEAASQLTGCEVSIVEIFPVYANTSSAYVNRVYCDVGVVEISS